MPILNSSEYTLSHLLQKYTKHGDMCIRIYHECDTVSYTFRVKLSQIAEDNNIKLHEVKVIDICNYLKANCKRKSGVAEVLISQFQSEVVAKRLYKLKFKMSEGGTDIFSGSIGKTEVLVRTEILESDEYPFLLEVEDKLRKEVNVKEADAFGNPEVDPAIFQNISRAPHQECDAETEEKVYVYPKSQDRIEDLLEKVEMETLASRVATKISDLKNIILKWFNKIR